MRSISVPLRLAVFLSLLGILFGFGLGGLMGGMEDAFKAHLKARADSAPESVYNGNQEQKDKVLAKSWNYVQRAHLHGGAIGTAALASILALAALGRKGLLANLSGLAFGIGSLAYPIFWLLAANLAPRLGSTSAAKKALEWIAVPGAGLTLAGLLGTLLVLFLSLFPRTSASDDSARP